MYISDLETLDRDSTVKSSSKYLNDNIINYYFELIGSRNMEKSTSPKVLIESTFYFGRFIDGYSELSSENRHAGNMDQLGWISIGNQILINSTRK